jgi:hypothetical protein
MRLAGKIAVAVGAGRDPAERPALIVFTVLSICQAHRGYREQNLGRGLDYN